MHEDERLHTPIKKFCPGGIFKTDDVLLTATPITTQVRCANGLYPLVMSNGLGGCKAVKKPKQVRFCDEVEVIDNALLEKSVGTKRFELRNEIPAARKGIADKEYRRLLCEDPWPVTESGDGLEIPDEIDEESYGFNPFEDCPKLCSRRYLS